MSCPLFPIEWLFNIQHQFNTSNRYGCAKFTRSSIINKYIFIYCHFIVPIVDGSLCACVNLFNDVHGIQCHQHRHGKVMKRFRLSPSEMALFVRHLSLHYPRSENVLCRSPALGGLPFRGLRKTFNCAMPTVCGVSVWCCSYVSASNRFSRLSPDKEWQTHSANWMCRHSRNIPQNDNKMRWRIPTTTTSMLSSRLRPLQSTLAIKDIPKLWRWTINGSKMKTICQQRRL